MGIWNRRSECMSLDELRQIQLERLQATINRAYENVAFYKRVFDQQGITPEDIVGLDDLGKLPFTTREDLAAGYPYDMFAVQLRDVVRIHSASGAKGAPAVCGYTSKDLSDWSELTARVLMAGGVGKDDVVHVFFGQGNFSSGFGFQYGAERIGASVIPVSDGSPDRQLAVMRDFRVTAVVGAPGYALALAETLEESGMSLRALSLRTGFFGDALWSEKTQTRIENRLGIIANDFYGLSELGGPGIAGECECKNGLHISEDHFLAEIVDPETGQPVEPGTEGELVITTLTKEALPLIRYRTRNLTSIDTRPCDCGRTLARMSRVRKRTDDMLIVQGVSIYPSQIERILSEIEGAEPHYRLVLDRVGVTDTIEIQVEVSDGIFKDTVEELVGVQKQIVDEVHAAVGILPQVRLVEPRTIQRSMSSGGSVVVDNRE